MGALQRTIERLNRWLSPAAVAASVEPSGGASTGGSTVNPAGVVAVVNELDAVAEPADEDEDERG